jgi:CDGSH-type Zn-finger protein/ferredoxin
MATIELIPDGPLIVKGVTQCRNSRGEAVAVKDAFYLCRCGASRTKPFCDGTHKKIGFKSAREKGGPHAETRAYAGREIAIDDNRSVCAHIGHCTERSPNVFRMNQEPWINPDGDPVAKTMATIKMCPSGALSYSLNQTASPTVAGDTCIHIMKDGPYHVVGGAELKCDPAPLRQDRYTLCRCGASKNKPYCDGSHWNAGFKDGAN